jgi:hypothetical protein
VFHAQFILGVVTTRAEPTPNSAFRRDLLDVSCHEKLNGFRRIGFSESSRPLIINRFPKFTSGTLIAVSKSVAAVRTAANSPCLATLTQAC